VLDHHRARFAGPIEGLVCHDCETVGIERDLILSVFVFRGDGYFMRIRSADRLAGEDDHLSMRRVHNGVRVGHEVGLRVVDFDLRVREIIALDRHYPRGFGRCDIAGVDGVRRYRIYFRRARIVAATTATAAGA
jgi:hypothetical protein